MSKKKLIKDNLLLLIGGNIGNVFSFLFNVLLLRADANLANLYIAYNSVILILGVPALVAMRILTIYGDTIFAKLKNYYEINRNESTLFVFLFILAFLPLIYLVDIATEESNYYTSFLIVVVAVSTFVTYVFRGLNQHEENFLPPVIALNIETLGRLLLGYLLGVTLGFGIYGILYAAIITLLLSLIPCFKFNYLKGVTHSDVPDYKFKRAVINSFILTAGTEFFSNFDIAYSLRVLHENLATQTEYTILQIFRKIIFYGIFIASSLILAVGSKNNHSKKFVFLYTLGSGLFIGLLSALVCYLFKDIFFIIINKELLIVNDWTLILFLISTALMSTSYLLSNWLLSLKKNIFTFIPIIASIIQLIIFLLAERTLFGLLNAFFISTLIFFLITSLTGFYEIFIKKHNAKL